MPQVDERDGIKPGNSDSTGLVKDAEGKDDFSPDKEVGVWGSTVKEEPTGVGAADQIKQEAMETSEDVLVDRCEVLTWGEYEQGLQVKRE